VHNSKSGPAGVAAARSQTTHRTIPDWLTFGVDDHGKPLVTASELRHYATLLRHRNEKTGRCDPGMSLLAKEGRCTEKTIDRLNRGLERAGALEVTRSRKPEKDAKGVVREHNRYRLIFDQPRPILIVDRRGKIVLLEPPEGRDTDVPTPRDMNVPTGSDMNVPRGSDADVPQTKALERELLNDVDDPREISSPISDQHRALYEQVIANIRPNAEQKRLIDEGFARNPDGVRHCWEEARKGRNPHGLFLNMLPKLRDDDWKPTDSRRKPVDPAVQFNTALTLCSLYYGDGPTYEDEIAVHVAKGVDEQQLRTAVRALHSNHSTTTSADNVVELIRPLAQTNEGTADAA
jgi:hypothetical protein